MSFVLWLWGLRVWWLQPDVVILESSGWCCWQVGSAQHSAVARPWVVLAPWLVILRLGRILIPLTQGCAPRSTLHQVMRWANLQAGGPLRNRMLS